MSAKKTDLGNLMWSEKYRPKKLADVVDQKEIIKGISNLVKNRQETPHMLFAGPAGVGKTTTALCIAMELLGENWRDHVLELNASVTPETPILVRIKGRVKRTNFGNLASIFFKDDISKRADTEGLEILAISEDHKACFQNVRNISRHFVNSVLKIRYEGGLIRTSESHSLIVIDDTGNLVPKKASELKKGDLLITFKEAIIGDPVELNFDSYAPQIFSTLRSGTYRNPKVIQIFDKKTLNNDLAWLFGLYLAEGCAGLERNDTSGQTIFTVAHPEELDISCKIEGIVQNCFELNSVSIPSTSGFDRSRFSSMQTRICNTQLTKFFMNNFYEAKSEIKDARFKRAPSFIFESSVENKISFLKGYMGDSTGRWEEWLRYSSQSFENLVDIAWLGRLAGLDTSCFDHETRIIWKMPSFSYVKTDLLPAKPFVKLLRSKVLPAGTLNLARHQLYGRGSGRTSASRISRDIAIQILERLEADAVVNRLRKLAFSGLSVVQIKSIEIESYDGYVYDVSVPGIEMFWGGTTPILLHNSDERGIKMVRERVKGFTEWRGVTGEQQIKSLFKIIILDEADEMTSEAQTALRAMIEKGSEITRFILICNYLSQIIEPIQSRCVVFRFTRLPKEDVIDHLKMICEKEKVKFEEKGLAQIFDATGGDMRHSINIMQAAAGMGSVTFANVTAAMGLSGRAKVGEVLKLALSGKFNEARAKLLELTQVYGMSETDFMKYANQEAYEMKIEKPDEFAAIMAEYDYRLSVGAHPEIQLAALLAQLGKLAKKQ